MDSAPQPKKHQFQHNVGREQNSASSLLFNTSFPHCWMDGEGISQVLHPRAVPCAAWLCAPRDGCGMNSPSSQASTMTKILLLL